MKLPAPLVKAWADLQLNFDAIARRVDSYALTASLSGPWSTGTPGATAGTVFTLPRTGLCVFDCSVTGYASPAGPITVEVWIDGVYTGWAMRLLPIVTTQMVLLPANFAMALTAGRHYVAFKQTAGSSDSNDHGVVSVLQP